MNALALISLTLIASISPLLTYIAFFQQKEWRFDRAKIALQEQGIIRTAISIPRLTIIILSLLSLTIFNPAIVTQCALAILIMLNCIQIIQHKQRMPTWTQKTSMITLVSIALTCVLSFLFAMSIPWLTIVLPVLQIVLVGSAVTILLPLDTYLKKKIFTRAKNNRRKLQNTTIIAITGSVGKTTCKHILVQLLKGKNIAYTPAFVNTELGVCNWFNTFMQTSKAIPEVLIVEMGAYRNGEIALLCDIFRPNISIITYIGTQHIALFGSQEKLLEAKTEIVKKLPDSAHAIFPGNYSFSKAIAVRTNAICHAVDLQVLKESASHTKFSLHSSEYNLPVPGKHNALNCALAIEAALLCGVSTEQLQNLTIKVSLPQSTFTLENIHGVDILDDTHNSSPESVFAVCEWAKQHHASQKILCLSGIIEQGSNQINVHRDIAQKASGVFSNIVCADEKIMKMLLPHFSGKIFKTIKECQINPNDTLIICEGRMSLENIKQHLRTLAL